MSNNFNKTNFDNPLYAVLYQVLATANPNIGTANTELVSDRINRLTEVLIEVVENKTLETMLAILEPYNNRIKDGFTAIEKELDQLSARIGTKD